MDMVEIIEVWQPVKEGGEALLYNGGNTKQIQQIAVIANGKPLYLREGFVLERRHVSKQEYELLAAPNLNK